MAITKSSSNAVAPAAKGDLVVGSATNDSSVLAVGANDTVLTADSAEATGLKWATASSGSMTLLSSGSLTSTSVTISSINQTYKDLYIVITNPYFNINTQAAFRFNAVTTASYNMSFQRFTTDVQPDTNQTKMYISRDGDGTVTNSNQGYLYIKNYTETCSKIIQGGFATATDAGAGNYWFFGSFESQTAITEVNISSFNGTSTFSGGTYIIYGVN